MVKKFFDPVERATMLSTALIQDLSDPRAVQGDDRYSGVFRRNQYASTLKKVESEAEKERLHVEALSSFLDRNRALAEFNSMLASCEPDDSTMLGYVLRRARHLVRWVLGDITTEEIFDAARHSNGVSRGVPFMDTSLNRKSTLPLTATLNASEIMSLYEAYDPLYAQSHIGYPENKTGLTYDIVEGSRATTVPKTVEKRRMIAVEPTVNMYFQQGLMAVMYKRLSNVGLDVKTLPERHRDLAYWSSVSGFQATLDLSNASDTVALELVRLLFPPKWLMWLEAVRSDRMLVFTEYVKLEAFATMGNATTFPVETLVFWALACATVCFTNRSHLYAVKPWAVTSLFTSVEERESVSVFGDDIILPTSSVQDLLYVLNRLGFSVNKEKSFFEDGPSFRESCGGDFFHGRDVRPWFIRGPTTLSKIGLEAWLYVMANTLLKKYRTYFGGVGYMYEKHALKLIIDWLREVTPLIKVVPSSFPDDSGLKGLEGLRLARTYTQQKFISPVGKSKQGWYDFKYLRFRYPRERKITEAIAYAVHLKNVRPRVSYSTGRVIPFRKKWFDYIPLEAQDVCKTPIRKKGEYIVARSVSTSF